VKGLRIRRTHKGSVRRVGASGAMVETGYFDAPPGEPLRPDDSAARRSKSWLVLDQLSDFERLFGPLHPRLQSCYWYLNNASFSLPQEWEHSYDPEQDRYVGPEMDAFFAAQVLQDDRQTVAEPGFLEKYGQYLMDYDWFEMLAFRGPA
jgi:hypothetical protein